MRFLLYQKLDQNTVSSDKPFIAIFRSLHITNHVNQPKKFQKYKLTASANHDLLFNENAQTNL